MDKKQAIIKVDGVKITLQQAINKDKKYRATFINPKTKRINNIEFGASNYQQFKDSTPLKLYKDKNHNDIERKNKYYKRHGSDEGIFYRKIGFLKNSYGKIILMVK